MKSVDGALMRTRVQRVAPLVFGSVYIASIASSWDSEIDCHKSISLMILFNTLGLARLRNLGLTCCFSLKCPCSEERAGGANLNPLDPQKIFFPFK